MIEKAPLDLLREAFDGPALIALLDRIDVEYDVDADGSNTLRVLVCVGAACDGFHTPGEWAPHPWVELVGDRLGNALYPYELNVPQLNVYPDKDRPGLTMSLRELGGALMFGMELDEWEAETTAQQN